jgi:PAS domain S-box-containing protein
MNTDKHGYTIFIVDDDEGLLRLIERVLKREGFNTATANSGQSAAAWLAQNRADLMLLDLKLEDVEGKELIERLNQSGHCPPFIIITGQGDERVAVDVMKRGAMDYLIKDVDFLQFVPAVARRALEHLSQRQRLVAAEAQVHLVRSAIDQGFSAVLITDADLPDPRVVYINPAFAKVTGYSAEKIVGRPLSEVASLSRVQQRLKNMPEGEPFSDEISKFQTPEGERWGEWRFGPVKDKDGRNTHWLIIFRDITERKQLEKEILEISDRERQRIGQDLHDGLCQHLAGVELMSQVLEQKLVGKSKSGAAKAGEIAKYVRDAISQTRALARGLSPVTLESEGLVSALQELAANTEKMFGITCRFASDYSAPLSNSAVGTHLYRIAQEAVSNAIKHGKASEIVIRFEPFGDKAVLTVTDNGSGMPSIRPKHRGMGLNIMQYRASMIGGVLKVRNHTGGGVSVVCSLPAEASAKNRGNEGA